MATANVVGNLHYTCDVAKNLNQMRIEKKMFDVTVKAGTTEFPCHSVILAAASDYFHSLFTSDLWTKKSSKKTTLEDIHPQTFEIVLEYMYSSRLLFTNENAFALLQAADFLRMITFLSRCIDYIEKNAHVVHILDIYLYAIHPLEKLDFARNVARNMASQFEEIAKTARFLDMTFDNLKIIIEEACYDKCTSCGRSWKNENNGRKYCNYCGKYSSPQGIDNDKILNALGKWMNHDLIERKKYFRQIALFSKIPEKYIHVWESSLNCLGEKSPKRQYKRKFTE